VIIKFLRLNSDSQWEVSEEDVKGTSAVSNRSSLFMSGRQRDIYRSLKSLSDGMSILTVLDFLASTYRKREKLSVTHDARTHNTERGGGRRRREAT